MKDLLLCVHVLVKTLNLEISCCCLANYEKEFYLSACRTCSMIIFPYSTNQIIVFWRCLCRCRRLCLSSVLVSSCDPLTGLLTEGGKLWSSGRREHKWRCQRSACGQLVKLLVKGKKLLFSAIFNHKVFVEETRD